MTATSTLYSSPLYKTLQALCDGTPLSPQMQENFAKIASNLTIKDSEIFTKIASSKGKGRLHSLSSSYWYHVSLLFKKAFVNMSNNDAAINEWVLEAKSLLAHSGINSNCRLLAATILLRIAINKNRANSQSELFERIMTMQKSSFDSATYKEIISAKRIEINKVIALSYLLLQELPLDKREERTKQWLVDMMSHFMLRIPYSSGSVDLSLDRAIEHIISAPAMVNAVQNVFPQRLIEEARSEAQIKRASWFYKIGKSEEMMRRELAAEYISGTLKHIPREIKERKKSATRHAWFSGVLWDANILCTILALAPGNRTLDIIKNEILWLFHNANKRSQYKNDKVHSVLLIAIAKCMDAQKQIGEELLLAYWRAIRTKHNTLDTFWKASASIKSKRLRRKLLLKSMEINSMGPYIMTDREHMVELIELLLENPDIIVSTIGKWPASIITSDDFLYSGISATFFNTLINKWDEMSNEQKCKVLKTLLHPKVAAFLGHMNFSTNTQLSSNVTLEELGCLSEKTLRRIITTSLAKKWSRQGTRAATWRTITKVLSLLSGEAANRIKRDWVDGYISAANQIADRHVSDSNLVHVFGKSAMPPSTLPRGYILSQLAADLGGEYENRLIMADFRRAAAEKESIYALPKLSHFFKQHEIRQDGVGIINWLDEKLTFLLQDPLARKSILGEILFSGFAEELSKHHPVLKDENFLLEYLDNYMEHCEKSSDMQQDKILRLDNKKRCLSKVFDVIISWTKNNFALPSQNTICNLMKEKFKASLPFRMAFFDFLFPLLPPVYFDNASANKDKQVAEYFDWNSIKADTAVYYKNNADLLLLFEDILEKCIVPDFGGWGKFGSMIKSDLKTGIGKFLLTPKTEKLLIKVIDTMSDLDKRNNTDISCFSTS